MAGYLGDFLLGASVEYWFNTTDAPGMPLTFPSAAVSVYEQGNATEFTTGSSVAVDYDSKTGMHKVTVDTTGGYQVGKDYVVWLTAGTVDAVSQVNMVLFQFSIQNRYMRGTNSAATASALALVSSTLDIVYDHVQGENITYGTLGLTGNDATHLHLTGVTYADDYLNDFRIVVLDISAGMHYVTWITDWVNSTALATVEALPFTPEAGTDLYWIVPVRKNDLGLNSLYDAAKTAAQAGELAKVPKSDGTTTWNATALGSINAQADQALADYDAPTNAEFEARTLPSADYFDPASDAVANVTTVGSVSGNVDGNIGGNVAGSVGSVTAGVTLADDAITAGKFDESTAFPLKSADAGATEVARTGADGDTLETLSDEIAAGGGGGGGDNITMEITDIRTGN